MDLINCKENIIITGPLVNNFNILKILNSLRRKQKIYLISNQEGTGIGASLLFGFADAGQTLIQQYVTGVPPQFIQMLPYILTLLALAGVVGKAVAPASSGKPYDKSDS